MDVLLREKEAWLVEAGSLELLFLGRTQGEVMSASEWSKLSNQCEYKVTQGMG